MSQVIYHCVIVGAGPVGLSVVEALAAQGVDVSTKVCVVSETPPFGRFANYAAAIGQSHMRSGWGFSAFKPQHDLKAYAQKMGADTSTPTPPVSVVNNLFAERWAVLAPRFILARVTGQKRQGKCWEIETSPTHSMPITTHNIVFATGMEMHRKPPMPNTQCVPRDHLRLPGTDSTFPRYAVIGGGMTAVQVASRIHDMTRHKGQVTIFSPTGLALSARDAADKWFEDPERARADWRTHPAEMRLRLAEADSRPGTINHGHFVEITSQPNAFQVVPDRVTEVRADRDGVIVVTGGQSRQFLAAIDARGYAPDVRNLTRGINGLQIECPVVGGYPDLDGQCKAGEGLFFAGALARLDVGPIAHTFYGGVRAAKMIAATITK